MTGSQSNDPEQLRRARVQRAISLALQGQWEEAVAENRAILGVAPNDVEALNRLGKALAETGRYSDAREAFQQALKLSPYNTIAKKNLERLKGLKDTPAPTRGKVAPSLFIEETGKSCIVRVQPSSVEALKHLAAGDPLELTRENTAFAVKTSRQELLGYLGPKLTRRLMRLMDGGNRYMAAVSEVTGWDAAITIREVYQHPSMAGVVSFPAKLEGYMAYGEEEVDLAKATPGRALAEWAEEEEAEAAPEPSPESLLGAEEEAEEPRAPEEEEEEQS